MNGPGELKAALGASFVIWQQLAAELTTVFPGLRQEWKSSKLPFGAVCLLKQKDRTLLYLLPGQSTFEVSIVLGERAVAIALASDLPKEIKRMISEARPYTEGRGIRFVVQSPGQLADIQKLVVIKTTPKG
jgi:hypothetical protein